ncbi:MAG: hypothetical protein IVW57_13400 [Ktedonobacterales bacterium]|nr:hypothetical protein [Ktedonobacterales bacterium]
MQQNPDDPTQPGGYPITPPSPPPPPDGYPITPPPPPPPKRSRRGLWITLGVVGGLLVLCGALLVGLVIYAGIQAAKPITVVQMYCGDLKTANYVAAYSLFSSQYQSQLTSDQFIQASKLQDQVDGPVQSCGLQTGNSTGINFDLNNNTARFAVQMTRNKTLTGFITLVKQGDTWRIKSIDTSLRGTDIGPLQVADRYCEALAAANYTAAYAHLASSIQSRVTEAQFQAQQQEQLALIQGQIAGCQPDLSTYAVLPDDTTASLRTQFAVRVGTQMVTRPRTLAFVKQSNVWKIASITEPNG